MPARSWEPSRQIAGILHIIRSKIPRVAALVSNFMTVALDHYDQTDINHQIIDVFPQKRGKVRTKILNIYSPPKNRNDDFGPLLNEAVRAVGTRDQLVVVGDFNAPSTAWGYVRDSPKGVLLENTTSKLGFTLITLPTAPTRLDVIEKICIGSTSTARSVYQVTSMYILKLYFIFTSAHG
ncbi:hypothetical protein HPB51_025985 [Rhipicephalus microplus]|uniref:Endonuclease/exonuclease/phosphatase domain-containing protein n=1 Tax=Rhipicephalus microplus TaxID=6941 RepID=A0A9J6EDV9_RHIMP|nr:hypothetical protein HPB51_025985 [Rhipicephalus microplus]